MFQRYAASSARLQGRMVTVLLWLLCALPAFAAEHTVLVLGDSLSAGYGLAANQGWVALLDERLATRRPGWDVVNASVSGETTAGGAARIAGELERVRPNVVVIELGANDGLRGLPLEHTRDNLDRMVAAARATDARVLILGMRVPPNYGPDYANGFQALFAEVAQVHEASLLPFFLEPVATDRASFQADNLHPVAEAQPRLLDHVWTKLAPLLDRPAADVPR